MWRSQSALSSIEDYEQKRGRIFKKENEIIQVQLVPAYLNNFKRDFLKLDTYSRMEKQMVDGSLTEKIISWILNKPFISKREQKINTLEMAIQDLEAMILNYRQADSELQTSYEQSIDKIDELGSQLNDLKKMRDNWTQQTEFLKSRLESGNFRYIDPDKNSLASQEDKYISSLVKLHNKTKNEITERTVKRAIERELSGIKSDLFDLQLKMDDIATDIVGLSGLCQFYTNAKECTQNIIIMSSQGVRCALSYAKIALEVQTYFTGISSVIEMNFKLHNSLYEVKKDVDDLTKSTNKQIQVLNKYFNMPSYDLAPKIETVRGKQPISMIDKALEIWENI